MRSDPALSPLARSTRTVPRKKVALLAMALGAACLTPGAGAQNLAGPSEVATTNQSANSPKSFATISEGLVATASGQKFLVTQKGGQGAYRYARISEGAIFEGVELFGANAEIHAAQRLEEAKVPDPAKGLLTHLWGTNAREWDGRVIPNEVAVSPPTLNLLPDPFNPANESGSFDPVRALNTGATPDPLGGSHAMGLTFSAANQQLIFSHGSNEAVNGPWFTPANTPLRLRLWAKLLSGGVNYTLGESTSKIALTDDWKEYQIHLETSIPVPLGFGSTPDSSKGVVAIAGAAIYDELAGDRLPDLQQLLADQNGAHGTMPLKLPGTIRFTPEGAIDNRVMKAGVRILTGADLPESPEYSLGVWVNPGQVEDPSYGTAISIGDHLDSSAKYNQGMLGIYSDKNSAIEARGRLRPFPTNNSGKKRTGQYLLGQGWQHLAITVKNGRTTPYINGIPIYEAVQEGWKTPRFNIVSVGYYLPGLRRQIANRYLPGQWQGAYVARKALTDEEVLQMDRHGRARLQVTGITPAPRLMVAFGVGGGELAKPESWWWHLCENYDLTPRLHGHLEAQNTGGLIDWASPERLAFLTRQILAAADSYKEVWCFVPSGGSDERLWATDNYDAYKRQYQDYLNALRAIHPKVRIAVSTALPRSRVGAPLKAEQVRQAWNDDLRANSADMNIDRLLDVGLGTERVDAQGAVTKETRPGGSVMGNWRMARAALAHKRSPAVALSLSATTGEAIAATAPAGTFGLEDVYRRIVAGAGSAQITNVAADGSQATLSTLGFTPKKQDGEGADQLARDSIVRGAFAKTILATEEWTIENDAGYYLNGTDQTYAGGRVLGDLIAPLVQQTIRSIR